MRKVRTLAVVLVAALASLIGASSAQAGTIVTQCLGTQQRSYPLSNGLGDTQGELQVWYSSANGGTNCAMVYDYASGSHLMTVTIEKQVNGAWVDYTRDSGTYQYYAGGVAITNTNGHCVRATGFLKMSAYRIGQFSVSTGAILCG